MTTHKPTSNYQEVDRRFDEKGWESEFLSFYADPTNSFLEIKSFLHSELDRVREETFKECLEASDIAIQHGILPIPNPFGDMVRIKRHNQVMLEVRDIFRSIIQATQLAKDNK